jgi:RimJ/RimL family protein N-acetyltransferase
VNELQTSDGRRRGLTADLLSATISRDQNSHRTERPLKPVLETERLSLREATLDDDAFVLALLHEPGWLRYVGDRGVHDLPAARRYISERLLDHYAEHGFGIWVVERKDTPGAIGLCGLVRREHLPNVDIGFAFAEAHWGHGYAREAALATLAHARDHLGLTRLIAITDPENSASQRVLDALGMRLEGDAPDDGEGKPTLLYARDFETSESPDDRGGRA